MVSKEDIWDLIWMPILTCDLQISNFPSLFYCCPLKILVCIFFYWLKFSVASPWFSSDLLLSLKSSWMFVWFLLDALNTITVLGNQNIDTKSYPLASFHQLILHSLINPSDLEEINGSGRNQVSNLRVLLKFLPKTLSSIRNF